MDMLSSIKKYASDIGFDACGVAPCRPMKEEVSVMKDWVRQDLHAGMGYMEKHMDLRINPSALYDGTKSVVVCLISYKTGRRYDEGIPQIASYARSADYHYMIKKRLARLLDHIQELDPTCNGRIFVDSGPVLEKHWAVEVGLGWQGRHSLLIHPKLGSFCFIGTILTSLELPEYDTPYGKNRCGSCRECIDRCPADAIRENGLIDCRKCLSFQTIENRGPVPEDLLPALENRLFGCDTCQDVCPWNQKPEPRNHSFFQPEESLYAITEKEWLEMGTGEFKRRFGHTPLARAGLKKLKQTLRQKSGLSLPKSSCYDPE